MRHLILLFPLGLLLFPTESNAQRSNLNKAQSIILRGEEGKLGAADLTTLYEAITAATADPELNQLARTWYLNGMAHYLFHKVEDFDKISKEDAIREMTRSFNQAKLLDGKTGRYGAMADFKQSNIYGEYLNEGVRAYQSDNLENAVDCFEFAAVIIPTDTSALLYAATVASEAKQYARAVKNYQQLAMINPSPTLFSNIIMLQKNYLKDPDAAMATLVVAEQQFPNDPTLERYAVDLLIQKGQFQQAIEKLNALMTIEPTNHLFPLRKALLYDQLSSQAKNEQNAALAEGYEKKAETAYLRTLELDPDNMTANFNYAVQLSQKANEFFGAANDLSLDEYNTKGKELEDQGLAILRQAVEPMETARKAAPEDVDVLYALETIYSRLGMKDKWQEVRETLKKLGN